MQRPYLFPSKKLLHLTPREVLRCSRGHETAHPEPEDGDETAALEGRGAGPADRPFGSCPPPLRRDRPSPAVAPHPVRPSAIRARRRLAAAADPVVAHDGVPVGRDPAASRGSRRLAEAHSPPPPRKAAREDRSRNAAGRSSGGGDA